MKSEDEKHDEAVKAEIRGATVILILGLVPYTAITLVLPTIAGAIFSVWYYRSKLRNTLRNNQGAKLGFYTAMSGNFVSLVMYNVVWVCFNYQIGAEQANNILINIGEWVGGTRLRDAVEQSILSQAQSSLTISTLICQLVFAAIMSGIFGAGTGALCEFFSQEKTSLAE